MTKEEIKNYCELEMFYLHGQAAYWIRYANMLGQFLNRLNDGIVEEDELRRYEANILKAVERENLDILAKSKPANHSKTQNNESDK